MNPIKVRKKPVVVEAMRLTPEVEQKVGQWCHAKKCTAEGYESYLWGYALPVNDRTMCIETLEGEMTAQMGDWIIKGVRGEFYPCKHDIFETTYDIVEEQTMSHTPGPWEVDKRMSGYNVKVKDQDYYICETFGEYDDVDKADAHLIAAAPELLEALEELLGWEILCPVEFEEKARAAIAKARGQG